MSEHDASKCYSLNITQQVSIASPLAGQPIMVSTTGVSEEIDINNDDNSNDNNDDNGDKGDDGNNRGSSAVASSEGAFASA